MMSCFVYLDSDQTPICVQRFDSAPGVEISTPTNAVYVADSASLPDDKSILSYWRMKDGVLCDVGPNPGPSYQWVVSSKSWVLDLTKAKDLQWASIKKTRNLKEFGEFVWDGSPFDSDSQAQSRIQGGVQLATLAAAAGQPFSIEWTLADNTVRTLSGPQMIAVGMALATHVQTVHAIGRALRLQIESATTLEAVESVSWPE